MSPREMTATDQPARLASLMRLAPLSRSSTPMLSKKENSEKVVRPVSASYVQGSV